MTVDCYKYRGEYRGVVRVNGKIVWKSACTWQSQMMALEDARNYGIPEVKG